LTLGQTKANNCYDLLLTSVRPGSRLETTATGIWDFKFTVLPNFFSLCNFFRETITLIKIHFEDFIKRRGA